MGGTCTTTTVGDFAGIPGVWFQEDGNANILSFSDMLKFCDITYDKKRNVFVLSANGTVKYVFRQSTRGLSIIAT